MAPPKPRKSSPEDGEDPKSRPEHRSTTSSKPKSTSTPNTASKSSSQQQHLSASPGSSKARFDLALRGHRPVDPLEPRLQKDLEEQRKQLAQDAERKKAEERTAWMRRIRQDPETGEKKQPKSTGSSSSDSPIRRVESPPQYPAHWTEEEKTNAEKLTKEGVKVAVYEQHRLDKDRIVRHQDYVTIAWDGCKNIDIPWHRFKIKSTSVSIHSGHHETLRPWIVICTNLTLQATPEMAKIQKRIGYNSSGKEIEVMMNVYPILAFPDKAVYQYEVSGFSLQHPIDIIW